MPPSRMEFELISGRGARAREPGAPLRMLLLADLGGARDKPLAQRQPQAVDIDRFGRLLERLAPRLDIELDGQPLALRFASIDDFHPDRLVERLPPFEALRRLRSEIDDPVQVRRAAAALGLGDATAPGAAPDAAAEAARADMERLLGHRPADATPAASAAPGLPALDAWVRQLVAPHVQPAVAQEQRTLRAAVDAALGALMRRVLHHPRFQALEAAWRGVEWLVRELDLGEALEVHLLDAAAAEVDADLQAHRDDLQACALHRLLNPQVAGEGRPWGLLVLDEAFGPGADDIRRLATLGALAARAGTPVLAAATPALAGAAGLVQLSEPRRWLAPDAPELVHWQALRTGAMAPWIGLVLPRVLLRLPYGAATDRIERFAFEEMPAPPEHEAYLWGHGSLALALLAGRACDADSGRVALDTQLDLEDLPAHVVGDGEGRHLQPVAERLLDDAAALALSERGLMPLLSRRDRPAARLLRWQSVAEPLQALRGFQDD